MKPTIKILENISRNSSKNKEEVFTRLYRYLLRPDLYYIAYKNLYANNGAATKGVNDDTADGFSENKVNDIINKLAKGNYVPSPTRRTYIQKSNGKLRPLGIPTFTDKLIQEVLRMILEAVYEPIFSTRSHGFRPNKSCHTALKDIKHWFVATKWFIEGDIKGCFDNINHCTLINIINAKIKPTIEIWKGDTFLLYESIEGVLYNEDGTEYKPPRKTVSTPKTVTAKSKASQKPTVEPTLDLLAMAEQGVSEICEAMENKNQGGQAVTPVPLSSSKVKKKTPKGVSVDQMSLFDF